MGSAMVPQGVVGWEEYEYIRGMFDSLLKYDLGAAVAAIHAGWKGTVLHIPEVAIETMNQTFGTRPAGRRDMRPDHQRHPADMTERSMGGHLGIECSLNKIE